MNNPNQAKIGAGPAGDSRMMGIAVLILLLLVVGVLLALKGNFLGVIIGVVALVMFAKGLKDHKADPPTVGLLTVWNRPVEGQKAVKGTVLLAEYFPFYLSTIEIEMTLESQGFPLNNVLSADRVAMNGEISLSVKPDETRLADYVAAGKMDGVIKAVRHIAAVETAKFCRDKGWQVIQQTSADFEQDLKREIETKPFGVVVEKLQVRLSAPSVVLSDAAEEARELLQRRGELTEYQTYLLAAQERLEGIKKHAQSGDKIPSLEEIIEKIKHERLIRDGKVVRVDGNARNLIVTESGLNLGGGKK